MVRIGISHRAWHHQLLWVILSPLCTGEVTLVSLGVSEHMPVEMYLLRIESLHVAVSIILVASWAYLSGHFSYTLDE